MNPFFTIIFKVCPRHPAIAVKSSPYVSSCWSKMKARPFTHPLQNISVLKLDFNSAAMLSNLLHPYHSQLMLSNSIKPAMVSTVSTMFARFSKSLRVCKTNEH